MEKIEAAARGERGRWAPGQSGNPAGKKPGTPNRATRLRELFAEETIERALQVLAAAVEAGNLVAARFVLDRLYPKPRERCIDLGLPAADMPKLDVLKHVYAMMATGEITIGEASRIARLTERLGNPADATVAPSARPAAPVTARATATASPAFDLQAAGGAAPDAATPLPLNRHDRRRAAALQRAARAPTAAPPLTAAA